MMWFGINAIADQKSALHETSEVLVCPEDQIMISTSQYNKLVKKARPRDAGDKGEHPVSSVQYPFTS
ncbi:hypothetical protein E4U43_006503 [Claviceps pusilla]|uniref:Uncharacterized protein n=1 Tax=Claviceps pusilla TaxID=123648 RepID=A0A9P7NE41_9HYPO|nr:hypothetical protein E4U43_006503 [Claviceps pusilla]